MLNYQYYNQKTRQESIKQIIVWSEVFFKSLFRFNF